MHPLKLVKILKTKKVTASVAFFIILGSAPAFGANEIPKEAVLKDNKETYKDIIEKSKNLSLQKERLQALNVLKNALRKEAKRTQAIKEISQALSDQAFLFYSEKAQQTYELAISLMNSDINLASAKIKEAISLEPENFSIEIAATKMMIALNDCASGLARVEKYKEFYPYLEDLRLVASQALVCINKSQEALVLKNSFKNENPELIPFWTTLEVEAYLKLSQANRALELINAYYGIRDTSSFESQKANPEIVYWKWKAESELKIKSDRTASTYISQCKTLTKRQQRALISEPNLCRHMAEVENFIKKNNN